MNAESKAFQQVYSKTKKLKLLKGQKIIYEHFIRKSYANDASIS